MDKNFSHIKMIFSKSCDFIKKFPVICSFFAGLLAKSAFASGEHVTMLILSVEIFFFIVNHLYSIKKYKYSLIAGYMYGLGLYAGIMYWETYLHDFGVGDLNPFILKWFFYLASIAYVAIYYALATYLSVKLAFDKLSLLLFLSIFISISEILQCFLIDGYPFTILAYGTHGIPYFSNIASVFGSYGVTFLFLLIIALINVKKTMGLGLGIFLFIISYNFYKVNYSKDYLLQKNNFEVTVVQPNFDDGTRKYRSYRFNCEDIASLAEVERPCKTKRLIITPETIIEDSPSAIEYFQRTLLKNKNIYAMTGFIEVVPEETPFDGSSTGKYKPYNAIHIYTQDELKPGANSKAENFSNKGKEVALYRKKHLIAFSEFFPKWIFIIAEFLPDFLAEKIFSLEGEDLSVGIAPNTINLEGIDQFDMNICYDIISPGQSMDAPLTSTWIVNVINLHNYCSGNVSDVAHQQNMICKFRAMEFGKPIAVCANYGISCFIDCNGNILQKLDPSSSAALHQSFPLKYRITTFCKYKNYLLYLLFVFIFLLLVLLKFKNKKNLSFFNIMKILNNEEK